MALHRLQQGEGGVQIVAVIGHGLGHGFAHRLEAGKVDHGFNVIFGKDPLHGVPVRHVRLIEPGGLSRNGVKPLQHIGAAVGEVVHDHDLLSRLQQLHRRMGPDKARPARQKNRSHRVSSCVTQIWVL